MIDFITGPDPDIRLNYVRLITFYVLPVVVILCSFLFWLIKGKINKLTAQERLDKTISTIAIVWFLFYPTIVSYLAQSINCTDLEGTLRLYEDLEEVCFQGRHLQIVFFISTPGLIIWAFGIPFLGLFLVRRFLHQITQVQFHSDPKILSTLQARFKLQLGFLTQGYQDEFYYWEIVLLLRKTILVLLLTFLAPISPGV